MDNNDSINPYLKTKVMTANPEELRLMLFEGAIKFCRQALDAIGKADCEKMYNAILRAQKIIIELSNALKHDEAPDLCDKLAALYNFMYRRLVDANISRDADIINEVIRLLEYERETWLMVMGKIKKQRDDNTSPVTDIQQHGTVGKISPASFDSSAEVKRPGISVQG